MPGEGIQEGEEWLNPHEHYYYQCSPSECVYQVDVFKFLECTPTLPPSSSFDIGEVGVRTFELPMEDCMLEGLKRVEVETLLPPSGVLQAISVRIYSTHPLSREVIERLRSRSLEALCHGASLCEKHN